MPSSYMQMPQRKFCSSRGPTLATKLRVDGAMGTQPCSMMLPPAEAREQGFRVSCWIEPRLYTSAVSKPELLTTPPVCTHGRLGSWGMTLMRV